MRKKDGVERKKLTGSTFAKIVAYFLLGISCLVGSVAAIFTIHMAVEEVYSYGDSMIGWRNWAKQSMYSEAINDLSMFYHMKWPDDPEKLEETLAEFCENKNIRIEVWKHYLDREKDSECVISNYDGFDTNYSYYRYFTEFEQVERKSEKEPADEEKPITEEEPKVEPKEELQPKTLPEQDSNGETNIPVEVPESNVVLLDETIGIDTAGGTNYVKVEEIVEEQEVGVQEVEAPSEPVMEEVQYVLTGYIDSKFPVYDEYAVAYGNAEKLWVHRYDFPTVALVCILINLILFIFLMCGAGHKNGKEGITPSILAPIHLDIFTGIFGIVACLCLVGIVEFFQYSKDVLNLALGAGTCSFLGIWCTIYCAEVASRFKCGQWWKHTIIYFVLRAVGRMIRFVWKVLVMLVKGIPLMVNTVIVLIGISFAEFMGLCIWGAYDELIIIWFFEKLILVPVVLYIALMCKKLQEGSKALADGNLAYQVDTSKMLLDFKAHGENLNHIGQGISKAVQERMKSEHMKTELITNVSHDIKTPLTSIINYADLLGNVAKEENHLDKEKVAEYSEVLLRQSKRLKKLLEDLVEASKATTGSIEVKMEKCEVGVLLSQAVGEYEPRFWEKQLELIVKQPQEPVWIMADGRRLWRVFDNLLNNVCKYAQENTRVYLTVEPKDAQVEIIFRNMSKYALDLTGEELEERFVRGDKSRHMEGNGLGLSIAKSLVELQNGKLEIITDGDLFKVILRFPMISA